MELPRAARSVSDLTAPAPYGRFRDMKKAKAKKSSAKKMTKPVAKKAPAKVSAKKAAAPKKAASAKRPEPQTGWGWPAFRYPLV